MSYRKRIKINNSVIVYTYDSQFREKQISYCMLNKEGKPEKYFDFCMSSDFIFSGNTFGDDIEARRKETKIEFELEKTNPVYKVLHDFLEEKEKFLLDDDFSIYDSNKKTIEIFEDNDKIKILFKNEKEAEQNLLSDKFHVFIKNIYYDGRSKLDHNYKEDNNTKERLRNLFYLFHNELTKEEYEKYNMDKDENKQINEERE